MSRAIRRLTAGPSAASSAPAVLQKSRAGKRARTRPDDRSRRNRSGLSTQAKRLSGVLHAFTLIKYYCFWTSPSFLMRDSSVVGLTPSNSAAAFVPRMRQLQRSSACKNMFPFSFHKRARRIGDLRSQRWIAELDMQRRTAGKYHRALDHVTKFTDVAGPWIAQQGDHRIVGDRVDRLAHRVAKFLDEGP